MQAGRVSLVLHCGDYCAPFSLMPFHDVQMTLMGVFGRNDGDPQGLKAFAAQGIGTELYESPHSFEFGDHQILVVHDLVDVAASSIERHQFVIHGHTHQTEMKTRGDTLLVNPGEGCGWLHGAPTAAILDLDDRNVEIIRLEGPEWARS
jgi:hypothetical protein